MKNLRLLSVTFDTPIAGRDIQAFRGAVIEKVGLDHDLYHNHKVDESGELRSIYRYPKVQYKRKGKRPSILFIDQGVEEAQHFFTKPDWDLEFAGKKYHATLSQLWARQFSVGVTEFPHPYTLRGWMGLNQKNYHSFADMSETEQIPFLERILAGNILGFATGVQHQFERRFEVRISEVLNSRIQIYKGVKVRTFDLNFEANVLLPPGVGIGKGASLGFGLVGKRKNIQESSIQMF